MTPQHALDITRIHSRNPARARQPLVVQHLQSVSKEEKGFSPALAPLDTASDYLAAHAASTQDRGNAPTQITDIASRVVAALCFFS